MWKYLNDRGHFVLSHNTTGVFDTKIGAYRVSPYLARGESDLMVFPRGRLEPVFMELKTSKGRLSADQVLFRKRVTELGHEYAVVRGVEDCKGLGL